ncbi:MAG: glycosyltransferase [Minwuia sp.]|nr:glycosyltransferase [Minwuia sp.]
MSTHILILPTEEFLPERNPLAGIFQGHQLDALRSTESERFGVLSVRLRYSVPMFLKNMLRRMALRPSDPSLPVSSFAALGRELLRRWTRPETTLVIDDWKGIPVLRIEALYGTAPSARHDPIWWQRAGMAAYRAYCERFGTPDLIHAHNSLPAGLLAARIARRDGVPYVLTEHSSAFHLGQVPASWFPAIRLAITEARAFLPVSHAVHATLERALGPLPVQPTVIGNVLPPAFADAARPDRNDASVRFLTVGSLLPVKNQKLLIDAFRAVADDRPDSRLVFVGDGPLRSTLEDQARDSGVGDRIDFLGELRPDGVRAEMLRSDVFVFPSHFETFGVVIIEAMACGMPVIAMASGGPEEILTPATGRLVVPDDRAALIAAMLEMSASGTSVDSQAIQNHARQNWGGETFCHRLRAVYASATGSPRAA